MNNFFQRLVTCCLVTPLVVYLFVYTSPYTSSLFLAGVLTYVMSAEWPKFHYQYLAPIYPLIPFLCIIKLNFSVARWELLFLCAISATHDTSAYIIGNLIGRHPLYPHISPKKSWEGFLGGTIIATIISYYTVHMFRPASWIAQLSLIHYVGIAIIINSCCMLGDLFESWLKRTSNLKDSGNILPGHGGILDRMDSLLGAIIPWILIRFLYN